MLDLDELEKLLAEATPGPWEVQGPTVNSESYDCWYVRGLDNYGVAETDAFRGSPEIDGADSRAIAALRNSAPTLLALARAGRGLAEAAGWVINDMRYTAPELAALQEEMWDSKLDAALAAWREADGG